MKKKRQVKGVLAEPIVVPSLPQRSASLLGGKQAQSEYEKQVKMWLHHTTLVAATSALEKLPLLFERYGLPYPPKDADWCLLSLALAMEFVPGFRTIADDETRGRKTEWGEGQLARLYLEVERVRDEKSVTEKRLAVTDAIRILKKRGNWSFLQNKADKTLYNRYMAAKKSPFVGIVRRFPNDAESFLEALVEIESR